jgi:hyperosmotically inducible protein
MRSVNVPRCCLVLGAACRLGLSRIVLFRPQSMDSVLQSYPETNESHSPVVDGLLIVVVRRLEQEKYMYQHRGRGVLTALVVVSVLLIPVIPAGAQTPADNTKVNKGDRADGAVTADQQKENASDRELAQKIRRAVVADTKLSTYAHNVKIVAQNGQVTLKGPVRTDDEKMSVEAKATEVAGPGRVTNEITIAPTKGSKK